MGERGYLHRNRSNPGSKEGNTKNKNDEGGGKKKREKEIIPYLSQPSNHQKRSNRINKGGGEWGVQVQCNIVSPIGCGNVLFIV